ncbi:MAG: tripartite tricarboxylate transporter TctB family protein [Hyphomicrobiales bacterium]
MARLKTLQQLFQRYRRPGDIVFAVVFLLFAIFLLTQLGTETKWAKRTKLFAQPAFWPTLSLWLMAGFAALHCLSSALSPRIDGRWREVWFWVRSVEYALWFMVYVLIVPYIGYLPATLLFTVLLTIRCGYKDLRFIGLAAAIGFATVIVFKSFLQVKIPGGAVYEYLPDGIRTFALIYL